ncbi:hypothetical protein DXG03_008027 [Asterophora parasitica]|uniref:PH domain-containing protein n=1 Tax=Asterophora parasitica TaxID=117018 RepID=A0A9P7G8D1_9AGAR|nr:hypothetical protein DXG03_008027 [Asterophora parasitica]
MSALLGKAGKQLFERHLEQYAPEDPLYETYTNSKGKQKRRKRALPPGLSVRDANILKSVKRRAHHLDKGFNLCGFRFGWTFIIGLIPVVGDAADITMSYLLVVRKARQADIPPWLLRRMLFNNAVSAGVGFIPVAGDIVVAIFKANSRNAALLEEFLRIRGEEYLKLQESGGLDVDQATEGKKLKKRKGASNNAEQVKPGPGMVQGEVVSTKSVEASSTSVTGLSSEKKSSPEGRRSFGSYFGRKNTGEARVT